RSDRMIATQLNFIAGLSSERRLDSIDQHLKQDSRSVQYARLFDAEGRRTAGNLEQFPPGLKMNDFVQDVSVMQMLQAGQEMEPMIHALAGVGNDIAHDLRTPLTRARLALERGRSNAATLEQLQTVTDKAIANIDQSLAIITALLRLAEIENSRRSAGFGDVPLHEMLREVCDIYEPIAENKNVNLRVEVRRRCNVRGDRDLLFEAVANLVDNAVKFTPEGGKVELEL